MFTDFRSHPAAVGAWRADDSHQRGGRLVGTKRRRLVVAHQRFVIACGRVRAMMCLPARPTVVAETRKVTAEVRPRVTTTDVTQRLLQVGIYLYLHA